jgi:hypothetical protein
MTQPKIHLDMDTSRRDIFQALKRKGLDDTRTPNPEVPQDVSDEYQLLWATSHQRILFSFNVKDYMRLARLHPYHSGILLANQRSTRPGQIIQALEIMINQTTAEVWIGQVRWINEWYFPSTGEH